MKCFQMLEPHHLEADTADLDERLARTRTRGGLRSFLRALRHHEHEMLAGLDQRIARREKVLN
jgi:hypothetical protein